MGFEDNAKQSLKGGIMRSVDDNAVVVKRGLSLRFVCICGQDFVGKHPGDCPICGSNDIQVKPRGEVYHDGNGFKKESFWQ